MLFQLLSTHRTIRMATRCNYGPPQWTIAEDAVEIRWLNQIFVHVNGNTWRRRISLSTTSTPPSFPQLTLTLWLLHCSKYPIQEIIDINGCPFFIPIRRGHLLPLQILILHLLIQIHFRQPNHRRHGLLVNRKHVLVRWLWAAVRVLPYPFEHVPYLGPFAFPAPLPLPLVLLRHETRLLLTVTQTDYELLHGMTHVSPLPLQTT